MNNSSKIILALLVLICGSSVAYASYDSTKNTREYTSGEYTYTAIDGSSGVGSESRINNLDHYSYYSWGIRLGTDIDPTKIQTASITFHNIWNWTEESYALHVNLLQDGGWWTAPEGVSKYSDNQNETNKWDYWNSKGIPSINLASYLYDGNGGAKPISTDETNPTKLLTLDITGDYLSAFKTSALDGLVGLGFDPDCHFYNSGVSLTITTGTPTSGVPEPTTMLLFGTGLLGLTGLQRRRRKQA